MKTTTENNDGSTAGTSPSSQSVSAPTRSSIRVWLTDDNLGFRTSLAQLLGRSSEFDCEREFHSAEALLAGLASGPAPDVILLDVEMGGMTGVDALRPIRALAPNVRVLIVTSFFDPMYESKSSRDGAAAFLLKANAPENLAREIHQALSAPVRTVEAAPVQAVDAAVASELAIRKSLMTRMTLWMVQFSATMFGQLEFRRPAATPK